MRWTPRLVMLTVFLLVSCRRDPPLKKDSRRSGLLNKTWELRTIADVDTSGGNVNYVSSVPPVCNQRLYFFDNDSLSTADSCLNEPARYTAGYWAWYTDFLVTLNTRPGSPYYVNIRLFHFAPDTLQLNILPYEGGDDSLKDRKTLQIYTYVAR